MSNYKVVKSTPQLHLVNNQSLDEFTSTKVGHRLWDSLVVKLVLHEEIVFHLELNEYIVKDDLKLINKDNGFTDVITKYVVEGYTVIDEVNYIFIKEKEQER